MNPGKLFRNFLWSIVIVASAINPGVSQKGWSTSGDVLTGSEKIGSVNCKPVKIIVNNKEKIVLQCDSVLRVGGNTTGTDTNMTDGLSFGPSSGAGRLEVNGFLNSTMAAMNVVTRSTLSAYITGIKSYSQPLAGYGYGIQSEGGRKGVYALNNAGAYSASSTYGVYASSSGTAGTRVGVYGTASGSGTGTHYGIYGYASGGSANYAGYFSGNVTVTGTFLNPSDRKLKDNIISEKNILSSLVRLQPAQYTFKKEYSQKMSLPETRQHGLIADDVEKVFPELVSENVQPAKYDEDEKMISEEIHYKGVNYIGFVPVLIESVKEQQQQIEQLKNDNDKIKNDNEYLRAEIAGIKAEMSRLAKAVSQVTTGEILRTASTSAGIAQRPSLEQNNPNPFSGDCEIHYFIPSGTVNAVINILNHNRVVIKSFTLNEKGNGSLIISTSGLPDGEYMYELIADGVRADVKKMMVIK